MIVDNLTNADLYAALHPGIADAFTRVAEIDLTKLAPGRYDFDGRRLYMSVAEEEGRGIERARLEAHQNYIDIQIVLDGVDEIGWKPLPACQVVSEAYDSERDIAFYAEEPDYFIRLQPGMFAIFFPHDAHAPLAGTGSLRKAVVKVLA